jgi:hypothetical protein
MEHIQRVFAALGIDWSRAARGYRVIVLDRDAAPEGAQAFLAEPGSRILYDDGHRLVILRSAAEADR